MPSPAPTSSSPQDLTSPPAWPGGNHNLLLGTGDFVEPLVRLETFSDKKFEIFTVQWAWHTLRSTYDQVQRRGGPGDKGRDVIGWLDPPGTPDRKWDNYQCKHYAQPLAPSDFAIEIAKLAYYTHRKDFTLPARYVIVTHKGVGPKLGDLLAKPDNLRDDVKKKWASFERKICKGKTVSLDAGLEAHLDAMDFSIFEELPPSSLLQQHKDNVPFHALIFGTGLVPRPKPAAPPTAIAANEVVYVKKIYGAIAEHLGTRVVSPADFQAKKGVAWQFNHARKCFYSAEALKKFARDSLPDFPSVAADLADEILQGVSVTLHRSFDDGYQRMLDVCEMVQELAMRPSVLATELLPNDRTGMLHHLANDNEIDWVDT